MKKSIIAILAAVLVLILPGCSKNPGEGRLIIQLTDAPFPLELIDEATVIITKVEIRKAGDGVSHESPFIVLWESSESFNLLDLRNGVIEELINLDIEAGEYDLVRLYVDEAGLKLKDGTTHTVKIPSGQQTGIKIFIEPGLIVEGGLTTELLLDFDLSNSFLIQGNMESPAGIKGFHFKPVIRAVNNSTSGILSGTVKESGAGPVEGVTITIKQGDAVITTALTNTEGFYSVKLLAGIYSVSASKVVDNAEVYKPANFNDIKVVAGNLTDLDYELVKN